MGKVKHMIDDEYIVPDGPFKGRKVKIADATYVSIFEGIGEEFMRSVFEMEPGDYLITDESSLSDFVCIFDHNMAPIYRRIQETYGLTAADLPSEILYEIFAFIHKLRHG